MGGSTIRDRLVLDSAEHGPAADRLAPILLAMSTVAIDTSSARRRPLRDVRSHADSVIATVPALGPRVRRLVDRLELDRPGTDDAIGAGVTVHGDLHDGQIMVAPGGAELGLLDLDDVGVGAHADDLGNLVGHLLTMATTLDTRGRGRVTRFVDGVPALSSALDIDHREVLRRAAAATLSLATGPFRSCEDGWQAATIERIDVAEQLAAAALPEGSTFVRGVSEGRHGDLIGARENRGDEHDVVPTSESGGHT